jgi:hypothetical protein
MFMVKKKMHELSRFFSNRLPAQPYITLALGIMGQDELVLAQTLRLWKTCDFHHSLGVLEPGESGGSVRGT